MPLEADSKQHAKHLDTLGLNQGSDTSLSDLQCHPHSNDVHLKYHLDDLNFRAPMAEVPNFSCGQENDLTGCLQS